MSGILYLVGTPIGNLGDISPRCAETLSAVDFIAAEDTRVTVKLLNHLGIKKPMVSYFEHNKAESGRKILQRIVEGENCAIVTDAGMPAISDPGEDLVALCAEAGVQVCAVPGPSAVVTALALSGLPTGRFTFEGFLATGKKSRREHLEELCDERRTMIFYEAPHKLKATLADLFTVLGDRRVSISREMTKLHEETLRTTLSQAIEHFEMQLPRGEFVIVVEGAPRIRQAQCSFEEALDIMREYMDNGLALREAARKTADSTGHSKNELYAAMLKK